MARKPYVGVTGPVTRQEVEAVMREFSDAGCGLEIPHVPMIGFLVSYKTLNSQPTANRRYPPIIALRELLESSGAFNMVHYNSKELDSLADQVTRVFDGIYQGNLCRALQLNIPWPPISQVGLIRERFPEMSIVFQASEKAMAGRTPADLARGIAEYGDSLSYVLIDPSSGKGRLFDVESSLAVYSELSDRIPGLVVGFAGGFTGENVAERLERIISGTGSIGFCIDAEGGLRDKLSSEYGDDLLNIRKVRGYLQGASSVLR